MQGRGEPREALPREAPPPRGAPPTASAGALPHGCCFSTRGGLPADTQPPDHQPTSGYLPMPPGRRLTQDEIEADEERVTKTIKARAY